MLELGKRLRVGVVDDEPTILGILEETLSEEGYQVEVFADAAAAQKVATDTPFDIILSDINMPEISGIDLLRYLKEIQVSTRVILMTAQATVQTAVEALRLGAVDYLRKPFENLEEVVALVHKVAENLLADRRAKAQKQVETQASESPHELSGLLHEIGLPNLLQMLCMVGKSGDLKIRGTAQEGLVSLQNGKICQARCGGAVGRNAIFRLLLIEKGTFHFSPVENPDLKDAIQTSLDALILDALRQVDEYKRLGTRVPPESLLLRVSGEPTTEVPLEDRMTLELVRQFSRVGDILNHAQTTDLETVWSLIRLRMAGFVGVVQREGVLHG